MYEKRLDGHVNVEALNQLDNRGITRKLKRTKPFQLVGIKLRVQKQGVAFLCGTPDESVSPFSKWNKTVCDILYTSLVKVLLQTVCKKLVAGLGLHEIITENKKSAHHEVVKLF